MRVIMRAANHAPSRPVDSRAIKASALLQLPFKPKISHRVHSDCPLECCFEEDNKCICGIRKKLLPIRGFYDNTILLYIGCYYIIEEQKSEVMSPTKLHTI